MVSDSRYLDELWIKVINELKQVIVLEYSHTTQHQQQQYDNHTTLKDNHHSSSSAALEEPKKPQKKKKSSMKKKVAVTIAEAFQHYAKLYIQYCRVIVDLNKCCELVTHPQKYSYILNTLNCVVCRIIELRCLMVKWYPPNPDVRVTNGQLQSHFPWEYIDLNDLLHEQSLNHEDILLLKIPRHFKDDCCSRSRLHRDAFIHQQIEKLQLKPLLISDAAGVNEISTRVSNISREDENYSRRLELRREKALSYKQALEELEKKLLQEEELIIRSKLEEERTAWIVEYIAQHGKPPSGLKDVYPAKQYHESKDTNVEGLPNNGTEKLEQDECPIEKPQLHIISNSVNKVEESVALFDKVWTPRLKSGGDPKDLSYFFDKSLAVDTVVRPRVEAALLMSVEKKLEAGLAQMQVNTETKKGKGGKKSTKKDKKNRGKKQGVLPGSKITELKNLSSEELLLILIQSSLIYIPGNFNLSDFIGSINASTSLKRSCESKSWVPSNPSINQLQASILEYCILPLASLPIKSMLDKTVVTKSVCLYGPSGTGKSQMAEAVAHELGALFINLSPPVLEGKYMSKKGPTELVHTVFTAAKDPRFGPVVIFIDDCEYFFPTTKLKKKLSKNGPSRFQKDLITYKNQCLESFDRVIIIGATKNPDLMDIKIVKKFFEKFLYFPLPNYSDRQLLWKSRLQNVLSSENPLERHKLDTLARLTEGRSQRDIVECCLKLSKSETVHKSNSTNDLIITKVLEHFAVKQYDYEDECKRMGGFTDQITGYTKSKVETTVDKKRSLEPSVVLPVSKLSLLSSVV